MIADRERNPRAFIAKLTELATEVVVDSWTFPAGVEPDADRLRRAARLLRPVPPEVRERLIEALLGGLRQKHPGVVWTTKERPEA
jgi:hypothetical protein